MCIMVSLDGGTTYIGTDFLKLEITGTLPLATYVQTQIAEGGGGGGGGDGYTDTQIDGF